MAETSTDKLQSDAPDCGAPPEKEIAPLGVFGAALGDCMHGISQRALVTHNESSKTVSVAASLADIARRIPDADDKAKLLAVANILDETALALPRGDDRENWVREEEVPRSTDALGRERMVKALGIETSAGAVMTDWTDVNEALRMHSMMRSFAPHDEDGRPVDRIALKNSVIHAIESGDRVASDGVDIPAILDELREKYTPMLMGREVGGQELEDGDCIPEKSAAGEGTLMVLEASLERYEQAEQRALAALKAVM